MASRSVKPGGAAGMLATLRDRFHVPEMPSIGIEEASRRVVSELRAQGKPYRRIDISDQPVLRGALFNAASEQVPFPDGKPWDRCYVALVDPKPAARWAHPAFWAFVPADGEGDVAFEDTNLPESSGGSVRLLPVIIEPS